MKHLMKTEFGDRGIGRYRNFLVFWKTQIILENRRASSENLHEILQDSNRFLSRIILKNLMNSHGILKNLGLIISSRIKNIHTECNIYLTSLKFGILEKPEESPGNRIEILKNPQGILKNFEESPKKYPSRVRFRNPGKELQKCRSPLSYNSSTTF